MEVVYCDTCGSKFVPDEFSGSSVCCPNCTTSAHADSAFVHEQNAALTLEHQKTAVGIPAVLAQIRVQSVTRFYFCETCGKRVTEQQIQEGQGRDKKLKGFYCKHCAVGVLTTEFEAISDAESGETAAPPELPAKRPTPLPLSLPLPRPLPLPLPPAPVANKPYDTARNKTRSPVPKPPSIRAEKFGKPTHLAAACAIVLVSATMLLMLLSQPAPAAQPPVKSTPLPIPAPALAIEAPPVVESARAAADGLVGLWKFDKGSGTLVADSSGLENNATLAGGTRWGVGLGRSGVIFDGRSGHAVVNAAPNLEFPNGASVTLCAWIKPAAQSSISSQTILIKGRTGTGIQVNYCLRILYKKAQLYYRNDQNTKWHTYQTKTNPITANEWQHVAATFTPGSANSYHFYVNGASQVGEWVPGTGYGNGNEPPSVSHEALWFGAASEHATMLDQFSGILGEVRIYNRALSAAEIGSLSKQH